MAARTFRKKKQQQSRVFFGVIFYVYTNVDNRERARASYWIFRREKNMEIQSGGEKMRNASGQQGEKVVQNSVLVVQNNGKGKTKKRAARANLFFAN